MKRSLLCTLLLISLSCGEEKNPISPGSSLTGMITIVFEENLYSAASPADSTNRAAKPARPALINSLEIRVLKSDNSLLVSYTDTPSNGRFEGTIEVQALNDLKVLCIGKNNAVIERFGIDNDVDVKPGETTEAVITGWLTPYTPYMNDISPNPSSDGAFTVIWNRPSLATISVLQEADNPQFTGARTVYTGTEASRQVSGKSSGTYYYRVSASNEYSVISGWSDPVSVKVAYTYTLSGTITGADGVTVTMIGDKSETQTVNNGEKYLFSVEHGGSYTVTPSKTGYTFTPTSKSFSNVTTNQSQDFAGSKVLYTITGTITGVDGVTVKLIGDRSETQTVNSGGQYTFSVEHGGTYTVRPSKSGYEFTPESKTFSTVSSNQTQDFTASEDITFVSIPGGTFQMGDVENSGSSYEKPVHTVTVSSFEMSAYEITNAQYAKYLNEALKSGDITATSESVTGKTGTYSGQEYLYLSGSFDLSNKCWISYSGGTFSVASGKENWPVVYVTWYGAKVFALYYGLDLPTEAEWEYACRGGKQYKYGTDDGTISSSKANYNLNIGYPVDVGNYPGNPFGLYDMSGNVYEWCHGWYESYSSGSVTNPIGAQIDTYRVIRGGSWYDIDILCRSAYRSSTGPYSNSRDINLGFRVVRRSSPQNY